MSLFWPMIWVLTQNNNLRVPYREVLCPRKHLIMGRINSNTFSFFVDEVFQLQKYLNHDNYNNKYLLQ